MGRSCANQLDEPIRRLTLFDDHFVRASLTHRLLLARLPDPHDYPDIRIEQLGHLRCPG